MQTRSSSRLVSNPSSNPTPSTNPNPKGQLHQLDIFYNALNLKDQDSLNSATGGNFLDKMPRKCLAIIESKSKVCYSRNKPVVAKVNMNTSTSAYQAPAYQALAPQTKGVSKEDFLAYVKANDAVMRNMQTKGQNMQNQLTNLTELLTKFVNTNNASTSSSGTLPSNIITNLRGNLKAITTRSGVTYDGPQISPSPSFLPKVAENEPEATKDTVHPTNKGSTEDVQALVVQSKSPILNSKPVNSPIIEPVASPISAPRPNQRPSIPYPSRLQDQKLCDKANDQREKFFQIFKDLNFNISFADALIFIPKFGPSIKSLLTKKDKLCELARTPLNEHCSAVLLKKLPEKLGDPGKFLILCDLLRKAECLALADLDARINLMPLSEVLGFSNVIASGNPTLYYDPIVSTTSPTLTPFENNDFLLEEVDAFLALEDDPTSPEVDPSYLDSNGDILLLEAFLNIDHHYPL
nr:reverse transcriptase domain-containing protein [Tanacetum cinerariifolium]